MAPKTRKPPEHGLAGHARRKVTGSHALSVELPQELYDAVRAEAERREQSMGGFVRLLLMDRLEMGKGK